MTAHAFLPVNDDRLWCAVDGCADEAQKHEGRFDDIRQHASDHEGLRAQHLDGWTCALCDVDLTRDEGLDPYLDGNDRAVYTNAGDGYAHCAPCISTLYDVAGYLRTVTGRDDAAECIDCGYRRGEDGP